MIEKICGYIELAKKEIFEVIENELDTEDISMEGAAFIFHCLENIEHLKKMKEDLAQEYIRGANNEHNAFEPTASVSSNKMPY